LEGGREVFRATFAIIGLSGLLAVGFRVRAIEALSSGQWAIGCFKRVFW